MISYDLYTKKELIERLIMLENDLLKMKIQMEDNNEKYISDLMKNYWEKDCKCESCSLINSLEKKNLADKSEKS